MKFSVCFEAQMVDTSRESEQRTFYEAVDQALYAEEMGFDGVWAVEHHALTQYAHMSAPETFLAFIAGQTKRIRIGHGVICLPPAMNHPVKVAERVATLDILSRGRVNFGVGKGGTQQEAGTFGYDLAELQPMIDESMYLIPRIMVEEEIEHDGKYIKIPRRPIHPKPYQQPHPPMYMACTRDESLITAASRGLGGMVLGFNTPEDTARQNRIYRDAFANRDPAKQVGYFANEWLCVGCPTIISDDREKARRIGLRGQRFFAQAIHHWYGGGGKPEIDVEDASSAEHEDAFRQAEAMTVAYLNEAKIPVTPAATDMYNVDHAYGTPQDAIAYLERLEEAGADEVLMLMQMGTVPHEAIMETIRHMGETVIPHFRAKEAKVQAA
ncbi:Flavin-dependent oxidoreductase, luciferase family (includes alkanesulfonate monooxygenase SsuD and methylene tetrahydromethanopterin reductase) [Sphingomonas laterariae]|uniref:Flavin-dependent oxidoreductase, luciferase family (Includes alkanesulfonate monooxygenase SsuD and methylene tetrahydromethanopterin reductase) n=1 Tax=Edaphosphingomonas laterariae TaxID=861865 RepID=A0A239BL38_9SPHN|nr:LLM class flavin-dependent oxidoreductase [Sphingomonas laterariae]SNS08865.1 Flavin-dependent oxidoreductase, luciferase family (includes alkanesulfonate monooxygenase SsuD and methylene tetrahydromethanopterin reductase) [Sphingomonas laterariae]